MAGYTRQSTADIIPTATVRAAPLNAEYNAIRDAFAASGGHKHDGTAAEGEYVPLIADVDANNKVQVNTSANTVDFYVEVSGVPVEQISVRDGVIRPITDNDIDLGAVGSEFKDLYIDGIGYIDTLAVHENATVAGTLNVTGVITAPAGVVANLTGNVTGNLTGDVTGDLTGDVTSTGTSTFSDLDAVDLSATGTTVITSGDINSGTIDNSVIGASTPAAGTFTDITADTSLTAATADINGGTLDNVVIGSETAVAATVTDLTATGTSTLSTVDINAGAIDGTTIGASTADTGAFTTVSTTGQATLASADIDGGAIDGTTIGATTPATGAFTTVSASGGVTANVTGNLTGNVTGNVTGDITGDVTGDLSGDVTSAGSSSFNNVTIDGTLNMNAGTTATITNLTSPTNTNDAATKGYVDQEVSALVDSAPGTLDTLNELAAALGDDADFSTTVTDSIATKLPKAGGTMSGEIAMGSNKITGVTDPTGAQDASTKAYTDAQRDTRVAKTGDTMSGALAMGDNKITGLATPTATTDATNKTYVDGILGSATVAATSASNAATSETNAATSETNAATSETNAATSATNAAASYDSFDDRYVGAKSSAPTLDNDGDALIVGALYFDTTTSIMKVYSSGGWVNAGSSVNGTSDRQTYTATAGQTIFAADYDAGYVDVYLNGVKLLVGSDFTATNGTNITLTSGAAVNDVVDIVAYGTFVLADHYTGAQSDARYVQVAGDTMTGNLSFGDNGKAIFGAGSDLQIYHDGSNSVIRDVGTGDLRVQGANLQLLSSNGKKYLFGVQDAYTKIYYDNAEKLATTSTGVDISGTITSDGLTVDNNTIRQNGTGPSYLLMETDTTDLNTRLRSANGDFYLETINDALNAASVRLNVDHSTGDISFYEDTGTTPKFFWDASAQKLNLTADSTALAVIGATQSIAGGNSNVKIGSNDAAAADKGGQLNFTANTTSLANYPVAGVHGYHETLGTGNYSGYLSLFTTSTGGSVNERMRIDSSGNVGIGTSSPFDSGSAYGDLSLSGISGGTVSFLDDDVRQGFVGSVNDEVRLSSTAATGYLTFRSGTGGAGTEAMRIDSSGNVGIGTASPSEELEIASSSPTIRLTDTNDATYGAVSYNVGALFLTADQTVRFNTNDTERMRIDSSGNLLVGKTAVGLSGSGSYFQSDGAIVGTRDPYLTTDAVFYANRLGDDGNLFNFYKDGTTVGSIGTNAGNIYLTDGARSLIVDGDTVKAGYSTGGNADAAQNLGSSSARWKDLYLSGGVYLGGTGSANKLDDYEEGTFTAYIVDANGTPQTGYSYEAQGGSYTKIGNMVSVRIVIGTTASVSNGNVVYFNLPFAVSNADISAYGAVAPLTRFVNFGTGQYPVVEVTRGTSRMSFMKCTSNNTSTLITNNDLGTFMALNVSIVYQTDA